MTPSRIRRDCHHRAGAWLRVKIGAAGADVSSMTQTPVVAMRAVTFDRHRDPSLGRIVRVYDRAIGACEVFDRRGATDALQLLRAALDLDSPASRSFDRIYRWCEESIVAHDFIGPARCLRSLRSAWCMAVEPAADIPAGNLPVC